MLSFARDLSEAVAGFVRRCQSEQGVSDYGRGLLAKARLSAGCELHAYQTSGFFWLLGMALHGRSAILGDEMGLGKTIQSLAVLSFLYFQSATDEHPRKPRAILDEDEDDDDDEAVVWPQVRRPLIIVPLSVLFNWQTEFGKFTQLRPLLYFGDLNERAALRQTLLAPLLGGSAAALRWDVLVTTPELLLKDAEWLGAVGWDYLVVDEAHRLKNRASVLFSTLLAMATPLKLLLSGTPVQNSVKECLALLHFANPDVFADVEALEARYAGLDWKSALQRHSAASALADELRAVLHAFMLRRLKADVLAERLPAKRDVVIYTPLTAMQRRFYQDLLRSNTLHMSPALIGALVGAADQDVAADCQHKATNKSLQNLVVQLRKVCNHPYLFDDAEPTFDGEYVLGEHILTSSAKLHMLDQLLPVLQRNGHRVLLYAQMTRMLDILQDYLGWRGYAYERLDGSTRAAERFASVDRFAQTRDCFVFLLSSRAGGQGLNLVAADVVIFYDRDWNPCVDAQAEARAHRIGQTKDVLVVKLVCRDSIEEFIQRRADGKSQLQRALLNDSADDADDSIDHQSTDVLSDAIRFGLDKICSPLHGAASSSADQHGDIEKLLYGEQQQQQQQQLPRTETFVAASASLDSLEVVAPDASLSSGSADNYYCYEGLDYRNERRRADADALRAIVAEARALADAANKSNNSDDDDDDELAPIALRLRKRRQATAFLLDTYTSPSSSKRPRAASDAAEPSARQLAAWQRANYVSTAVSASPVKQHDDQTSLEFRYGNVCQPQASGPAVVAVCLDNSGRWRERGLFAGLLGLHPPSRDIYVQAKQHSNLKLGQLHVSNSFARECTDDDSDSDHDHSTWVALIIAQRYVAAKNWQVPEIQQASLRQSLQSLAAFAQQHGASVHLPRIGYRTSFNWYGAEKLIRQVFSGPPVITFVELDQPESDAETPLVPFTLPAGGLNDDDTEADEQDSTDFDVQSAYAGGSTDPDTAEHAADY